MHDLYMWLTGEVFQGFLSASVRLAVPLLLTALGGIFAERSGVLNLGMEGMMLSGALTGFSVAAATHSAILGAVAATAAAMLLGLVLGFFTITLPSDQVIAGIALNLLVAAATSFLYRVFYGSGISSPVPSEFSVYHVPLLSKIPVIGAPLFDQDPITYVAVALVVVTAVIMRRTVWGINIDSVGENPDAAETLGLNVARTRYRGLAISAAFAGLGGAFLTLVESPTFLDNLTNGRGYIALAILIVGRRRPLGVLLAALLFGSADALQLRTQLVPVSIPFQFMLMLPYLLTMVALAGLVRRHHVPTALGIPFRRQH
jgi:general nucleoside transport system permease protein